MQNAVKSGEPVPYAHAPPLLAPLTACTATVYDILCGQEHAGPCRAVQDVRAICKSMLSLVIYTKNDPNVYNMKACSNDMGLCISQAGLSNTLSRAAS